MLKSFVYFLDHSPTVFHAAQQISDALHKAKFILLQEGEAWQLEKGKQYFVCRNGSLVAAFRIPKHKPQRAVILASHIDSPCLKIKPHAENKNDTVGQLNTEIYGAPILHSWLDRDLRIAGRLLILNKKKQTESILVSLEDHPVIIPSLAIHLDRTMNDKGFVVDKQENLRPIFSLSTKPRTFLNYLHKRYAMHKLLASDLFVVPHEKASFLGLEQEYIASHRLDNLTSAFAALSAVTHSPAHPTALQIAFFWDHEEIGSVSATGADSSFAAELLERICLSLQCNREEYFCLKNRSVCISNDVSHGLHPHFLEKYDVENTPILGKGPVIKYNANQKYATNTALAASIKTLAHRKKIPLQEFSYRSDIPAGSTAGSIMAAHLGIPTVDIGISCWAMHSARETIASQDEVLLCSLCTLLMGEQ